MILTSKLLPIVLSPLLAYAVLPVSAKLVLVAGGGTGGDDSPAKQAKLESPFAVDFDRAGNLYFAEMTANRVRKIDGQGVVTTIAGTGHKGDGGDGGPAVKAELNGPHHLAVGPDGDLYVADTWNNRVRRINLKSGTIDTIAGTGRKGFSGDGGPAVKAEFGGIYCLAFDAKGERLYLADLDNRRIRAVDLRTGMVNTAVGNGGKGVPADGAVALDAPLMDPRAVAVDAHGNIYVLERSGHALRVVDPSGKVRTLAGTGKPGHSGDGGDARQATLNGPKHLCVDREGNMLIADTENHAIRKYQPRDGRIVAVAGTGKKGDAGLGGPPVNANLSQPHGVYLHSDGTLYISDSGNHRILRIEQ